MWIWAVGFTSIFMIWVLRLEHVQRTIASKLNRGNITVADYSVLVKGFSGNDEDCKQLLEYAAHYGQVYAAFRLRPVGPALLQCEKVCGCRRFYARSELLL